jgi:alpha-1,6-mannosyltransferase
VLAASQRGSPVRVGGFEATDTWGVLFLALVGAAFLFYILALLVLRSRASPLVLVVAIAAVIQLTPLAGPLLLSRDVYSYWAYGRIVALHDRNPFVVPPIHFAHDPATRAAAWRRQTSVYGPAFTLATGAVAEAARHSSEVASFLFRLVAAVGGLAAAALAALIARRKAFAFAFLGWNPLVALSFAGGGHNDAWMVVLLLSALALVARRRDVAGGAVWLLAAAVKAPALALFLLQRSRRGFWLGAAAAAVVVAAASTAIFGGAWLTAGAPLSGREASFGLPARLESLGLPGLAAHGLALAVLVVGAVYLARRRPSLSIGASLLVFTSPWVLPWYATWPVALAAVEEDVAAQVVAVGLALYLLPDRVTL